MSVNNEDAYGYNQIQQTQGVTPAEIAAKARKTSQAIQDIVEAASHISIEPAGKTAPLAFLAELPSADFGEAASYVPPSAQPFPPETVAGLSTYFAQNSKTILDLIQPVQAKIQADPSFIAHFQSFPPAFQSSASALATALLIDSINAEQAATGAKLGIVGASIAGQVESVQKAAAQQNYQSGIQSADATYSQAQADRIAGVTGIIVGSISAAAALGSVLAGFKALSATKDAESAVTEGDSVAVSATQKATKDATEETGIEMTSLSSKASRAGQAAPTEAQKAADAATAAASKAKTDAAKAADAAKIKVKTAAEEASEKSRIKDAKIAAAKWTQLEKTLKATGDTVSSIGQPLGTYLSVQDKINASTEQTNAAQDKLTADVSTALASYLNQFMESSSSAAKTSMDNSSQTAQASQTIKQAASQSASSIYRG